MVKRKRALSPEEAEWEATREERTRYIYQRLNDDWRERKARLEASEGSESEARGRAESRLRILRRLRRFR